MFALKIEDVENEHNIHEHIKSNVSREEIMGKKIHTHRNMLINLEIVDLLLVLIDLVKLAKNSMDWGGS